MRLLSFSLLLCLGFVSKAQKAPIEFGKIPMKDMAMTIYEKDSSAGAVVLVDYGKAYLSFGNSVTLYFDRHIRIKILSKEGLRWADASIPLYHSGSSDEKVINLKASTYNLESGKIIETTMSKDGIFKEAFNQNINVQKFTLPNVKEGSILEYSYTVSSDFLINFPEWEFQRKIPTAVSEYWVKIPDIFVFEKYVQGYVAPSNYEETSETSNRFNLKVYHWVSKDVPAFKVEPYMTCEDDYISKVNFALSYFKPLNGPSVEIMGSWTKLNELLLEHENFGQIIAKSGFLKNQAEELVNGITEPRKKIEAIHNYVKQNFEWNGTQDLYCENLKKVVEKKKGSAADLNLLLASMLNKAGFIVDMVILSTRDHGFVRQFIPMTKQFNYVICAVRLNGVPIFLDATEKYLPMNTLPERCLNGQGLMISKITPGWVDITSKSKSKTTINADLILRNNGDLKGTVNFIRDGYDACDIRKEFHAKGQESYLKSALESKNWEVEKSEFNDMKEVDKPAKETHHISILEHVALTGDVMYINPFIEGQQMENPFKSENRVYPVDFGSPLEKMYLGKFIIPEGFVVDEMPKNKILNLPDKAGKYVYSITQLGNTINFVSNLQINKTLFIQTEYPNLREFFSQVVAKQAEQIVLKKQKQ